MPFHYVKSILVPLLLVTSLFGSAVNAKSEYGLQKPILWKLETQPPSWLFGTIHIPDDRVNQLPLTARIIFNQSDVVLTEIPMEFGDTISMQTLMKRTDQKPLQSIISDDLYHRLDKYLLKINLPGGAKAFDTLKIWAIYASLPMLETQLKHPLNKALDANIYQQAKQQGKEVGGLETIVEQMSYLEKLSTKEQITLLDESLQMLENDTENQHLKKMFDWYLQGGQTHITDLMSEIAPENSDKALEAKLLDMLLTQRNKIMAERIVEKLKTNPEKQFFIAIGAGHLSDEKNVPYFLEKLGIKSTRFIGNTKKHD
jgi:uncharacterized protein YbaP (TraB family)